jgi:AAA15 family ATPase/GTPase
MIIDFSIENFKSIKERITLSFEPEKSGHLQEYYIIEPTKGIKLLKFGIIYGPNGSGKSTILDALHFLKSLVSISPVQKQEPIRFKPFLFDERTQNQNSYLELNFVHASSRYRYQVTFNQQAVVSEKLYFFSPNKALIYRRETDTEKQLAKISFGSKIKIKKTAEEALELNTLWNSTVLNAFLKTNIESVELKNVTDWFLNTLQSKISPDRDLTVRTKKQLLSDTIDKSLVIQLMKKADFHISDFSLKKEIIPATPALKDFLVFMNTHIAIANSELPRSTDEVENIELTFKHSVVNQDGNRQYDLPYEEESAGTQRYFQFSGLLTFMLNTEGIHLIDEFEASIHPDLLKHFLLMYLVHVKRNQLIVTTHYRELLMERDILRNDAIWLTEKKTDGSCDLFSVSDFDSSIVRDTTSVFNAYKTGKLGAVPILSDYYLDKSTDEKH